MGEFYNRYGRGVEGDWPSRQTALARQQIRGIPPISHHFLEKLRNGWGTEHLIPTLNHPKGVSKLAGQRRESRREETRAMGRPTTLK
jgi:hypothetical protein